jgi:putative acetyltransferase
MADTWRIERADITDERSLALIGALNDDLIGRYPPGAVHFFSISAEETAPGRGAFLVAVDADGTWCGCGAVRRLDDGRAEIKRMYTAPAHRRRGIGRGVLGALIDHAAELGCTDVVLETGGEQPESLALYESFGFRAVPCWGEYAANEPDSICMQLVRP